MFVGGARDQVDHICALNRELEVLWKRTLDDSLQRAEELLVGDQSWEAELLCERILAHLEPCRRVYSVKPAVSALMAKLIDLYERRGELWAAVKMQERLLATEYYPPKEHSFNRLANLYRKFADQEKELLQNWVDTNAITPMYKDPILSVLPVPHRVASVRAEDTKFFATFFDSHPNQHAVNIWGQSVLYSAAKQKNYGAIPTIVKSGITDTTASDVFRRSPMHLAVESGSWKTVNALIKQKCDINKQDIDSYTPLHRAVREHDLGIVWCLINASADLSLKNGESRTPLHTAVINSNFEAARMLLQNAADASETDDDGETLLHKVFDVLDEYVSMHDKKILIKLLLEKGADSCAENGRGHSPLRYAIENYCSPDGEAHRREIIDLLIAKGADLATTDKDGQTPLHWAVTGRYGTGTHCTTFEYLIQRCEVNTKDKGGDTAMHLAARYGRADLIEVLLKYNVDYLVENYNHESPFSLAYNGSHPEIISMFINICLQSPF